VWREPIDLDLVSLEIQEGNAMDGTGRGEEPMATTARMPAALSAGPASAPPTGLPSEQLYTWLEWVQDDLRRVESRLQFLEAARNKLREQERLLGELLAASSPVA
jgi:hypothetical protein